MCNNSIEHPFIMNPFISKIINLFDSLRYQVVNFGISSCVLITGESGSGKSEIAKFYVKNNPIIEESIRTHIPVLHFELKAISTPIEFLRSLLVTIGDPQVGLGAKNAGELFNRLVILIRSTGVELIILDEIQVIIERRSERVITGLADLFKDLIKETNIPIVFMGMPWSRYLIDSNSQLKGRISYRYVIPPYRISNQNDRDDYRRLLKSLADAYNLSKYIKLEELSLALRFFSFSNGNLRTTANLVRDAYIFSKMNNIMIDIGSFADVVRAYGMSDDYNPFLLSIDKLELRELLVYSDWHFGYRADKNSVISAEFSTYGVTTDKKIYSIKRSS